MLSTVCVVERDQDNGRRIKDLLHNRFLIIAYSDAPSVLEGLNTFSPDLLVLDLSVPGLDGAALVEQIHRQRELPVIALTAHASHVDRKRLLAQGFSDQVAKPFADPAFLVATIERCLARSGGTRLASTLSLDLLNLHADRASDPGRALSPAACEPRARAGRVRTASG